MNDRMFTRVWVKTSGDHDSLSRRNVVVDAENDRFSPGHIVRPGTVIHLGRMTCGGYIKFVGTYFSFHRLSLDGNKMNLFRSTVHSQFGQSSHSIRSWMASNGKSSWTIPSSQFAFIVLGWNCPSIFPGSGSWIIFIHCKWCPFPGNFRYWNLILIFM